MGSKPSVQLRLHSAIYLKGALEATKEAYEDFAELRYEKEKPGPYWVLDVTPLSDDFDGSTLALEVANFILAENMHAKRGEQA